MGPKQQSERERRKAKNDERKRVVRIALGLDRAEVETIEMALQPGKDVPFDTLWQDQMRVMGVSCMTQMLHESFTDYYLYHAETEGSGVTRYQNDARGWWETMKPEFLQWGVSREVFAKSFRGRLFTSEPSYPYVRLYPSEDE